jgi:hypothetical protein
MPAYANDAVSGVSPAKQPLIEFDQVATIDEHCT